MKCIQLYEQVIKLPEGGVLTKDAKLDEAYVWDIIHSARAAEIVATYEKKGYVNPVSYQYYTPKYILGMQENDCYVEFDVPNAIQLSTAMPGEGYIGSAKADFPFIQIANRIQLSQLKATRLFKPGGKFTYVLIESGKCKVYGRKNKLVTTPPSFSGIWPDPFIADDFNVDFDEYPVDQGLIDGMKRRMLGQDLVIITRSAIDRISNMRDDSSNLKPAVKP